MSKIITSLQAFLCITGLSLLVLNKPLQAQAGGANNQTEAGTNNQTEAGTNNQTEAGANNQTGADANNQTENDPSKETATQKTAEKADPSADFPAVIGVACTNEKPVSKEKCIDELISAENKLRDLIQVLRLFDDIKTQSLENNCLTERAIKQTLYLFVKTEDPASVLKYSVNFGTDGVWGNLVVNLDNLTGFVGILGKADKSSMNGYKQMALSRILLKSDSPTPAKITQIAISLVYRDKEVEETIALFDAAGPVDPTQTWELGAGKPPVQISKKEFLNNPKWAEAVRNACEDL